MNVYQKGDYVLFNTVTDAVNALDAQNFGQARELLISGQQTCEELFLASEMPQKDILEEASTKAEA